GLLHRRGPQPGESLVQLFEGHGGEIGRYPPATEDRQIRDEPPLTRRRDESLLGGDQEQGFVQPQLRIH
ncbi:hypothetical protein FE62_15485, partial [Staphylococcus aureus]